LDVAFLHPPFVKINSIFDVTFRVNIRTMYSKLSLTVNMIICVQTSGMYYLVENGFRGVHYRAGKVQSELLRPGDAGFMLPNTWPFFSKVLYTEIKENVDVARGVTCVSSDGQGMQFDEIKTYNKQEEEGVIPCVKKWGQNYDHHLLTERVPAHMREICSKMTAYDLMVGEFSNLNELLQERMQTEQDKLETQFTITHVQMTQPQVSKEQKADYEAISKEKTKQMLAKQQAESSKLENERLQKEAEAEAARKVTAAQGDLQVAQHEAEAHTVREKAKTDSEVYAKEQLAEVEKKFSEQHWALKIEQAKAWGQNKAVYWGEKLPEYMWGPDIRMPVQ